MSPIRLKLYDQIPGSVANRRHSKWLHDSRLLGVLLFLANIEVDVILETGKRGIILATIDCGVTDWPKRLSLVACESLFKLMWIPE